MVNFKELDRIELSINELFRLFDWRDKNKALVNNYKQVIPEGIVEVKGGMTIYFKFLNETITVYEAYTEGQTVCKLKTERLGGHYRVLESWINQEMVTAFKIFDTSFDELDLIADTCTTISSVMTYLEHFKSEVIIRQQPISMTNTQRRKAIWHNKQNNVAKLIKLQRTIYKIPDGARHTNPDKLPRQKHTDSWGVRGHQRHLRDGKVVWVKPYTKGNGAVKKHKIYKIDDI
ncbi:hypothetical protein [Ruminiclostridium josui]|uniref:hypothetical protein n=1 Tax=Ruminiclostridium josui TaxID=1499 RepID=UPI000463AFF6|nr:hypothetical protein [Ruminiclostridium josui]